MSASLHSQGTMHARDLYNLILLPPLHLLELMLGALPSCQPAVDREWPHVQSLPRGPSHAHLPSSNAWSPMLYRWPLRG